jgi:hypothetical protein
MTKRRKYSRTKIEERLCKGIWSLPQSPQNYLQMQLIFRNPQIWHRQFVHFGLLQ